MDIKVYYNGKLDRKREIKWAAKKAAWHAFVYIDSLFENNRLPSTAEEKEKAHSLAMSFARGERRPW